MNFARVVRPWDDDTRGLTRVDSSTAARGRTGASSAIFSFGSTKPMAQRAAAEGRALEVGEKGMGGYARGTRSHVPSGLFEKR